MIARSRVWRPAIRRSPSELSLAPWRRSGRRTGLKSLGRRLSSLGIQQRFRYSASRGFVIAEEARRDPPAWSFPSGPPPTSVKSARSTRTTSSSTRSSRSSSSPTGWAATPRARLRRRSPCMSFATRSRPARTRSSASPRAKTASARRTCLTLLEHAVQGAGDAVYQKGQAEPEKRGMGTTASALLHRRRSRLHRPRRRQPHLHAPRRPGRAADRGPLAGQRAHPPRPGHQGGVRQLPLQGLQERGHPGGRRLRDRPGRHHRLRGPARATSSCSARTGCTPTSTTSGSSRA